MKKLTALFAAAATLAAVSAYSGSASAAYNLVYLHGRSQSTWDGTIYGMSGWNVRIVSYNATTQTLAQANANVRDQLGSWCSNGNYCIVIAYSNGVHQLAYTEANYPSCLSGMFYAQTGGAAFGGSDLLDGFTGDLGDILGVTYPSGVDAALHVSSARNAYNHNLTGGKSIYMATGNTNAYNWIWTADAWALPGDDDGVVAYHSAVGCSSSGSQSLSCAKFSYHTNRCNYTGGNGEFGGGWFSAGTDHFGIDNKAAYCF